MADETTIQHPIFKDQYYNVPADSIDEWTNAGWVKTDAPELAAGQIIGPPSGAPPRPPLESEQSEQPTQAETSGKSGKAKADKA
jgi:hypothetical protein